MAEDTKTDAELDAEIDNLAIQLGNKIIKKD